MIEDMKEVPVEGPVLCEVEDVAVAERSRWIERQELMAAMSTGR